MAKRFKRPSFGHKSYHSAINGVSKFVFTNLPDLQKGLDGNQRISMLGKLMREYLNHKNIEHRKGKKYSDIDFNANLIQNDFDSFRSWIKENKTQE